MTVQQAEQLVRRLQALIGDDTQRGARRRPSLLPAPKSELLCAIRLCIAQLYLIGADDELRLAPIIRAAMAIDSFTDTPIGATEFVSAMVDRRREIEEYRGELARIPRDHNFFWQQVYPLAGIEVQTKRATIFETIQQRLKRPFQAEPGKRGSRQPDYDYVAGRYNLEP
jgi:hypothetical protein